MQLGILVSGNDGLKPALNLGLCVERLPENGAMTLFDVVGHFLPLYAGFMHLPAFLQAAGDLQPGQGFMGGSNAKSPRRCGRGWSAARYGGVIGRGARRFSPCLMPHGAPREHRSRARP